MKTHKDSSQEKAIKHISSINAPKMSVLTGGPGYGKTYTIQKIINQSNIKNSDIYLAAPTGKAAKVLQDAISISLENPPCTIHRMLGCCGPGEWRYNPSNRLPARLVILDESSMIDSLLMARILSSVDESARFILVGDKDQLPPVNAGCPFRDIINGRSTQDLINVLEINHRQIEGSMIADGCERIKQGKIPRFENDLFFIEEKDKEKIPDIVSRLRQEIVKDEQDCVVLAPQRKGVVGVENLNQVLQAANSEVRGRINLGYIKAGIGDRVLHTKNNYKLGVFNGYLGTVAAINGKDACVDYDGELFWYDGDCPEAKRQLSLGYCITCHKSQGSQWKQGIIVCHSSHYFMWSRSLLYTALSRFREKCWIVGDKKALRHAVRNVKEDGRQTLLKDEL